LAAVLLGPADTEPAVLADLADDFLVDRRLAELAGRGCETAANLRCDEVREVLLELCAESNLRLIEIDMHDTKL
jgi:hypothetical protein